MHVEVESADEGVAVLDRIQPWLPVLLALSANSPFWQGRDSGYASYRYQAWGRWPSAGPTGWFGSASAYAQTVEAMIGTAAVLDAGMVYFNARLSDHYPTVEVRVADVCLFPGDAVLIAALVRALAETEARAWRDQAAGPPVRLELLKLAAWRASRSGLDGDLVHPGTGRPAPPGRSLRRWSTMCGPPWQRRRPGRGHGLLEELLARGNGAAFQRAAYGRSGQVRTSSPRPGADRPGLTAPGSLAQQSAQGPRVADRVTAAVVVEVGQDLGALALPLPDAVRPPGQAVVGIGARVEPVIVGAVQADVGERRGHPQDAGQPGAAHDAVGRAPARSSASTSSVCQLG